MNHSWMFSKTSLPLGMTQELFMLARQLKMFWRFLRWNKEKLFISADHWLSAKINSKLNITSEWERWNSSAETKIEAAVSGWRQWSCGTWNNMSDEVRFEQRLKNVFLKRQVALTTFCCFSPFLCYLILPRSFFCV